MTGGSETLDLPQGRARPRDSWGYPFPCWTQAYEDSVSKQNPLPMLGSLVRTTREGLKGCTLPLAPSPHHCGADLR